MSPVDSGPSTSVNRSRWVGPSPARSYLGRVSDSNIWNPTRRRVPLTPGLPTVSRIPTVPVEVVGYRSGVGGPSPRCVGLSACRTSVDPRRTSLSTTPTAAGTGVGRPRLLSVQSGDPLHHGLSSPSPRPVPALHTRQPFYPKSPHVYTVTRTKSPPHSSGAPEPAVPVVTGPTHPTGTVLGSVDPFLVTSPL